LHELSSIENIGIPLANNAINNHDLIDEQQHFSNKELKTINKQSKSPHGVAENTLRHSPNGKNKRLLTKDIMSGEFY
jgi:hypothetical protein